ncbi:hypothetical protein J3R30DRAFT_3696270 [Lentinula aciculospora]|uniref:Hydrophobin n=1 Tax=Lentinula aciculospora TaxID=153920 RepID=A0A9W9DWL8_9AGAR|nr:hypothetical protein J3R30DRAFT_3695123 [Lentinula aciculospora]KAJ4488498.1 hypothetical protein J3R30DRAFT_3696270 [Lentinula aciculospora]
MLFRFIALVAASGLTLSSASPLPDTLNNNVRIGCSDESTLCSNVPNLDVNIGLADTTNRLMNNVIDTAGNMLDGLFSMPDPMPHVEI